MQANQRAQQSLAYGKEKQLDIKLNTNNDADDLAINDDTYCDNLTREVEEKFAQLGKYNSNS